MYKIYIILCWARAATTAADFEKHILVRLRRESWGQCYKHHFRRFSPIVGKKVGVFVLLFSNFLKIYWAIVYLGLSLKYWLSFDYILQHWPLTFSSWATRNETADIAQVKTTVELCSIGTRVTRLGEFSQTGRSFHLVRCFFLIKRCPDKIFCYL
jgi:hypothetical protein